MSMTKDGIDLKALWERKRQMIASTPGLSVYDGLETFEAIGGVENAKQFMTLVMNGKAAPQAIVARPPPGNRPAAPGHLGLVGVHAEP